jgi:hypothetical protein
MALSKLRTKASKGRGSKGSLSTLLTGTRINNPKRTGRLNKMARGPLRKTR